MVGVFVMTQSGDVNNVDTVIIGSLVVMDTWVTGSDEKIEMFDHFATYSGGKGSLAVRLRLDGGGQSLAVRFRLDGGGQSLAVRLRLDGGGQSLAVRFRLDGGGQSLAVRFRLDSGGPR